MPWPTQSYTLSVKPPRTIFSNVFSLLWACLAFFAVPWPNLAMYSYCKLKRKPQISNASYLHLFDLVLLPFISLHLLLFHFCTSLHKGIVISSVVMQLLFLEVHNVSTHTILHYFQKTQRVHSLLIHKILRVRHHEKNFVPFAKIVFEPHYSFHIQLHGMSNILRGIQLQILTWFVGSSNNKSAGWIKRALARAILMRQPPLKLRVGCACFSGVNPKPLKG